MDIVKNIAIEHILRFLQKHNTLGYSISFAFISWVILLPLCAAGTAYRKEKKEKKKEALSISHCTKPPLNQPPFHSTSLWKDIRREGCYGKHGHSANGFCAGLTGRDDGRVVVSNYVLSRVPKITRARLEEEEEVVEGREKYFGKRLKKLFFSSVFSLTASRPEVQLLKGFFLSPFFLLAAEECRRRRLRRWKIWRHSLVSSSSPSTVPDRYLLSSDGRREGDQWCAMTGFRTGGGGHHYYRCIFRTKKNTAHHSPYTSFIFHFGEGSNIGF